MDVKKKIWDMFLLLWNLDSINLKCSKEKFTFPYKFKHGVVMEITGDEYERIKKHKWINKK